MCAHQVSSYGPLVTSNDPTTEPSTGTSAADHPCIPQYEIRVEGHLGTRWAAWFDGLDLTDEEDGITVIRGPVVDQAALHGLLQKLRDVGIPLVSLTPVSHDATTTPEPTLRRNEGN
jgi:hypothetical protein